MNPKAISIAKLRNNLKETIDSVDDDTIVVVTKRGEDQAVIVDIDKFEDLLAASNPKYLKTIEEARESDRFYTHDEVFGDLD